MRQVLTIATRELKERRLVVASGAVLALLTLFTPLLPGVSGFTTGDTIGTASAWLSVMILLGGALIVGMTSINGDLTERRLGFYFSKPVSGLTIWGGKVIGALAVVLITALIALLPAAFDGFGSLHGLQAPTWLAIFGGALGLFFFGHVGACIARVRSIWILLDVVGAFVLVAVGSSIIGTFSRLLPIHTGGALLETVLPTAFFGGIAVMTVASAAGVAVGRVEPARVHRWTSVVLWGLVGAALLFAAAFVGWFASSTPRDLRNTLARVDVHGGEWLVAGGRARGGLVQEFALQPGGRHLTVGSNYGLQVSDKRLVAIAPERSIFFMTARNGRMPDGMVVYADTDASVLEWKTTKIAVDGRLAWIKPAVSRDGTRLALPTESGVAVYSLPDETLVRSVALDERGDSRRPRRMAFVDDSRLRILWTDSLPGRGSDRSTATEIAEVELSSGSVSPLLTFQASSFAIDSTYRTVVAQTGGTATLFDVESGNEIGSFESDVPAYGVRWLSGDRLAIPDRAPDGGRVLRVVTREGMEIRRVELPGYESLRLGHEPRQGTLTAVASSSVEPRPCEEDLLEIELEPGTTRVIDRGIAPLRAGAEDVPVGSSNATTFLGCGGRFLRYDDDLTAGEPVLE